MMQSIELQVAKIMTPEEFIEQTKLSIETEIENVEFTIEHLRSDEISNYFKLSSKNPKVFYITGVSVGIIISGMFDMDQLYIG